MFCTGPNFLSHAKNLTAFSASSKTFVPAQKNNFAERKSSFCLAQNFCDRHNMIINVWTGSKNLDQLKTFWDL